MNACLLAALALSGPPAGALVTPAALAQTTGSYELPSFCSVQLMKDVEVPAEEAGLIIQLDVKPESLINQGDVLAVIDSSREAIQKEAAEAALEAATIQAENHVNIDFADAQQAVSAKELQRRVEINQRSPGVISQSEIEQYELQVDRARFQREQAVLEQDVAKSTERQKAAELQAIEHSIQRRTIRARMNGLVAEKLREQGEWVREGDPILRLITIDQVKVSGRFNLQEYSPAVLRGRPVVVTARVGGQVYELTGTVTEIGSEATVDSCPITAEVENRREQGEWILRSGMSVSMAIQL